MTRRPEHGGGPAEGSGQEPDAPGTGMPERDGAGWDGVWFGGPRSQPEQELPPHGFVSIEPDGYPRADEARGPLPLMRPARHPYTPQGQPVAPPGPPVRLAFRTGGQGRTALHNATDEFTRQLARQQDGLNAMTAADYLRGRELFLTHGRGDGREERKARDEFHEHLVKQNKKAGFDDVEAERLASASMEGLAVLHEPDSIAGGVGQIGRDASGLPAMGRADVNASIGAQQKANVALLDQVAADMMRNGQGQRLMHVEIALCAYPEQIRHYQLDHIQHAEHRHAGLASGQLRAPPEHLRQHQHDTARNYPPPTPSNWHRPPQPTPNTTATEHAPNERNTTTQVPSTQTPNEQAPAEHTPTERTSNEQKPSAQASSEQTPADPTPNEQAPAGHAPTESVSPPPVLRPPAPSPQHAQAPAPDAPDADAARQPANPKPAATAKPNTPHANPDQQPAPASSSVTSADPSPQTSATPSQAAPADPAQQARTTPDDAEPLQSDAARRAAMLEQAKNLPTGPIHSRSVEDSMKLIKYLSLIHPRPQPPRPRSENDTKPAPPTRPRTHNKQHDNKPPGFER